MNLSNTAVPIYYGQFREKVLRGEIPVNEEISMQMNRIDQRIADPRFYYDPGMVEGYVAYCNEELTLTNGEPLHLLDTFCLWAEDVLGWYYFVDRDVYEPYTDRPGGRYVRKHIKKRLTKKQFLIVGRGAAKTMYSSTLQSYTLNIDPMTTSQAALAPTVRQADEVLSPIRTSIVRSRGPLFKLLTRGSMQATNGPLANRPILYSSKDGIVNRMTGSKLTLCPMSIDKIQGFQYKMASVDEWLSGDIREDVIGALEQGSAKNEDYLIVATSSEGTVRNAVGDSIKMELVDILKGKYYAPHVSIWYYKLDDIKEVSNPAMWVKAQPNIGHTVSYETYHEEVERAENVPSARNDILAKRFGIPLEGFTYFFTYEETMPHFRTDFYNMACAMGMDASQGDDFWAFDFWFPVDNYRFGLKTVCFVSEKSILTLPNAMRIKYDEFLEEGSLHVMEGTILDPMKVYDEIERYINENRFDVRAFGYDPYNAKAFVERWVLENGPYGVEKVPQGSRTESVPLGEIKHLAHTRSLLFDQKIVQFTMGNAITMTDTNGNRKLYKKRLDHKIDVVAAAVDALVAYKAHIDAFE